MDRVTLTGESAELETAGLSSQRPLGGRPRNRILNSWADDLTPEARQAHVLAALDSPHLPQRRARPARKTVPAPGSGVDRLRHVWGNTTGINGLIGASERATPSTAGGLVANVTNGAPVGALLHKAPAPSA